MRGNFSLQEVSDGASNKRQLGVLAIGSGGLTSAQARKHVGDRHQPVRGAHQREPLQRERFILPSPPLNRLGRWKTTQETCWGVSGEGLVAAVSPLIRW